VGVFASQRYLLRLNSNPKRKHVTRKHYNRGLYWSSLFETRENVGQCRKI